MRQLIALAILLSSCTHQPDKTGSPGSADTLKTVFEESQGLETATYEQTISYFTELADQFSEISIQAIGQTDSGEPLHLVTFNSDKSGDNFEALRSNKRIMLINNGIHPGEPDGIDATMILFRDLATGKIKSPEETVITTIPIYNVGGSLNRNSTTRTNQNGPAEYGFRGNARNYDLNRDFIKADTENSKTFTKIYHLVQPDVFIDTHVSNGADYQYTLTHLFTQHNKLGDDYGKFLHGTIMPELEEDLRSKSWDITPYVNVFNRSPERGFRQFFDAPRYSTGYTTLFNSLGMMVETHMLKPYKQRVEGTYELLLSMLKLTERHGAKIRALKSTRNWSPGDSYPLSWEVDTTMSSILNFKGFEMEELTSDITGAPRIKYNRSKPFTRPITYQNYYKPKDSIQIPKAYIIPQGWHDVINLLKLNQVDMMPFQKDTLISAEVYTIEDYKTRQTPYEGHYMHYSTKVKSKQEKVKVRRGDYLVFTDQPALRYLMETLEPTAQDSFFNWNFFDTILQQKEGFSPYVWEDRAKNLLRANPNLQIQFNIKKTYDEDFRNSWYAQLDWLHKNSEYYEKAHLRYPVYRLN